MQQDLISVIIPTYKHKERLGDLVDLVNSLLITTNIICIWEIIIVDNGNSLSSNLDILKLNSKIKIIKEPNIGLNYARNTGVDNATANIIAFLDDDVIVSEYWAKSILYGYNKSNAMCVGGPVFIKDNNIKKLPIGLSDYFLRFLFPPSFPYYAGYIYPPHYLIGANMSFKKEVFKKFGVFDIELDRKGKNLLSNGDIEFIIRIPKKMIWYEPQAKVFDKIKEKRLTKIFMTRRLFWQGISDYILVKKRGLDNFYDKREVYITTYFLKKLINNSIRLKFFEIFCMFVRLIAYKFAFIYVIKKRSRFISTSLK